MAIDFPSSPSVNDSHTSSGKTWIWTGDYWKLYGTQIQGINLEISDTAPTPATQGDMWFESDTGRTFTYYDGAWVELGSTASITSFLTDADADTRVHVEESADEDVIRFDVAGTEKAFINSTGLTVSGDIEVTGSYVGLSSNSISDADNDTKIQVEETADEDVIRFDTAGVERMTIAADGTVSIGGNLDVTGTISGVEDPRPIALMMMGA